MKSSPEVPQSASTSATRRWLIVALALVAILTGGYFFARPAYRAVKKWRSQRLAAQAAQFLSHGDWKTARAKAQAAMLLAPGEPTALRAMAQVLTRGTNPPPWQWWQRLVETGQATVADRRTFVEQALRAGATASAVKELDKLLQEAPSHPVNLWLGAQFFAMAGDREQTMYYAARAHLNDPTNQQYQLFLASLRFDSAQPEQRFAAHSNVWEIATDKSAMGLEALSFLAQRREVTSEQRQRLIALLRAHPAKTTAHELLALGLQLLVTPEQRGVLLDDAAAQFKASDAETRLAFAVWLNQNSECNRTLELLPLAEALKRKDFFLSHADALAALGQWDALKKIFETKQTPLEQPYAEAFRARCEKELRNGALADLHWRQAVRTAERNPEQLMWLASYAEKCAEFDTAKRALRSLIACVENPRPAFQLLERVTERAGPTAELRDLLGEMANRWPDDAAYQNDFAYLNALLNTGVAAAAETAGKLVGPRPENLAHRTTLALAHYRQGDYPGALKAYGGRDFNWPGALANQRAVYAAVLAANDRASEARELARNIPREQLRAEELELIQGLR
ncbi:MAG: hypothetical protein EXS35_00795 [Pedosphaera sp.]|nr:hypothetical protein [Pedosphaera sp.]